MAGKVAGKVTSIAGARATATDNGSTVGMKLGNKEDPEKKAIEITKRFGMESAK